VTLKDARICRKEARKILENDGDSRSNQASAKNVRQAKRGEHIRARRAWQERGGVKPIKTKSIF
jgi:hypothetical protein